MIKVPPQLRMEEFRFYKIRHNTKRACEKEWTTKNNYHYEDRRLARHTGNYGVCCGYGNLIVIDFDDKDYFNEMKHKLPKTFTVITASKRLPHYYYVLKGAKGKISKIGIDKNEKRVCDIQTHGSGVVGPGSTIDRRFYEPDTNPIVEIELVDLIKIFDIQKIKQKKEYSDIVTNSPKQHVALAILYLCGVEIKTETNMKCPFHGMEGAGNLSITPTGKIYCFHEQKSWWADEFLMKCKDVRWQTARNIVKMVENLYQENKNGTR